MRDKAPLELTEADLRTRVARKREQLAATNDADRKKLDQLAREIAQVAEYVTRLRREIKTLKTGEIYSKQLPDTVTDLRSVQAAAKSAADGIMAAAEAVLERDSSGPGYPEFILDRVTQIMEACSFQDIAGQRLNRAMDTLQGIEKRLERFSKAVKIADATDLFDRQAIIREARREVLMLKGPQNDGQAIEQSDVDKLFD